MIYFKIQNLVVRACVFISLHNKQTFITLYPITLNTTILQYFFPSLLAKISFHY